MCECTNSAIDPEVHYYHLLNESSLTKYIDC